MLTKEDRNINHFNWSPDSKWIAYDFGKTPMVGDNINFSDIAILNVNTGESKLILHTGAAEDNPKFSSDGKLIAYECSEDPVVWGGRSFIKIIPVEGGTPLTLASTPDVQPALLGWDNDNKHVFITEPKKTLNAIYKLSADGKEILEWTKPATDLINIPWLNSNNTYFGFTLQNTTTPGEAFISSAASFSPQKITNISC